jgi:hypothetical protein
VTSPAKQPPPSAVFPTALAEAAPATEPTPAQTEVANE